MIIERRLSIRAAVDNDDQKPFMEILLTPWLCFALVPDAGRVKVIPGVSLASAQTRGLAYLRGKKS